MEPTADPLIKAPPIFSEPEFIAAVNLFATAPTALEPGIERTVPTFTEPLETPDKTTLLLLNVELLP